MEKPEKKDFKVASNRRCDGWDHIDITKKDTHADYYDKIAYDKSIIEYQEAVDRCIFLGWEIGETTYVDRKGFESKCLHIKKHKNTLSWEFDKKQMTFLKGNTFYQKYTIEDLITSVELHLKDKPAKELGF